MSEANSRAVTEFHGRSLPEPARPVGYADLIERYRLGISFPPDSLRRRPDITPPQQTLGNSSLRDMRQRTLSADIWSLPLNGKTLISTF